MNTVILNHLEQFFDEIEPLDFYRRIFPEGELEEKGKPQQGKYHGIAVELLPEGSEPPVKRHFIYNDLQEIEKLLESENFIIISPISYIGRSRESKNARSIYAVTFDLDGIETVEQIKDLFHQMENDIIPHATYVVFSGTGLHLYYLLSVPLPCFPNIVKEVAKLKKKLCRLIWNRYITNYWQTPQDGQSLFQGFRLCGGVTKDGHTRTRAFETGEPIDLEYLNSFVPEEYKVNIKGTTVITRDKKIDKGKIQTERVRISLEEAQKRYPAWYEQRIIQQMPKGTFKVSRHVFDWWYNRIKEEATVGHRFWSVAMLSVYARKCGIDKKELEEKAFSLLKPFDDKSIDEKNRFTRQDILCSLEMFNDSYITMTIESISKLTNIPIERNKRNYRKQKDHIKYMNAIRNFKVEMGETKITGRPSAENIVKEWQQQNKGKRKVDCIKDTGLSRPTVSKYWVKNL